MQHDIRMTAKKIASRLRLIEPLAHRKKAPLGPLLYRTLACPEELPPLEGSAVSDDEGWETLAPTDYWGGPDVNFAMRGRFSVPSGFDGEQVALYLPLGEAGDFGHPEALAYIDGAPYSGVDRYHQEFLLADAHRDGKSHDLVLHGWTGLLGRKPGNKLSLRECAVVQIDAPTREFVAAARTALEAATHLNDLEPAKARLLNALDDAFMLLETRDPLGDAFYASVPAALTCLREGIERAGAPMDAEIIAAGHAHIDVAWLWTLGQTRRKAGRTFHTALRLMEQFPSFSFTQSQPQLYSYIKADYPALFEDIQKRVEEGRWEPIGGMWVEADCNITGPESLARQFLLGRSFFREHFGEQAESPVLWLPDVFGYAWNLPQLIKLAGMEYFFTIKIGWNQVNKLPNDSFYWQGLDGTKVLTHFSTTPESSLGGAPNLMNTATYNADLTAFGALGTWAKLQHKEAQNVMLMSYGFGDGGGGPTREMNENARELRSFPALPRVTQGKVIDFFRRLEQESGDKLPTWNSELYLEIHRGTYTTQSRNKRANRKAEFLLHDAEFAASFAAQLDPAYSYPHEAFREAWRGVCLNQFHDIIPGSSINAVYVESQEQYKQITESVEAARSEALEVVRKHSGGALVLVNPTSFRREDLALWQGELPENKRIKGAYTQAVEGGTLIASAEAEPYSAYSAIPLHFETGRPSEPDKGEFPLHAEPEVLENAFVRVELNKEGDITRIYDKKARREVLPQGAVANQFQAFEDRPLNWDAWDIDIFYDDKLFLAEPAESIQVVENGPLRATLEIRRRVLNSLYTQRISLTYNSPRIDISTEIDWRERHILLKAAFPVDVLATVATYEIQWGSVQRPTHRNTSWDWARFETCAQKWVDLSEGRYGVAVLNDCKYGHDMRDNVIRISLLRAPTNPDPEADQGRHSFTYSIFPHAGLGSDPTTNAHIAAEAYALNDPLIVAGPEDAASEAGQAAQAEGRGSTSFVSAPLNTIIETIKQAEDGEGVIVRLYECNRTRGPVQIELGFPIREAYITNLLEENTEKLETSGRNIEIYMTPFQIVTLRLVPA